MSTAQPYLTDGLTDLDRWARTLAEELADHGDTLNGSPSDTDSRLAYERMGQAGLIGLSWPRTVGGREMDPVDVVDIEERLGYHWLPLCGYLLSVKTIGSAILRFGTPELVQRFLPDVVAGRIMFCQGFSEPTAGSDLGALRTRAVRRDNGWVVDGHKIWISGAELADWMYLAVRSDPDQPRHRGLSVLLVDMNTPGVSVDVHETLGGGTFGEIALQDVFVPSGNLIGEVNDGWRIVLESLNFERVTSEKVGATLRILDELDGLVDSRDMSRRVAALRGELDACRRLGYQATRMIAAGKPVSKTSSMCKLSVAIAQQKVAALCSDALGPLALVDRGPAAPAGGRISAFIRSSVSTTIAGGASDVQRKVIAQQGLGLAR